jgi:hypothetical protein
MNDERDFLSARGPASRPALGAGLAHRDDVTIGVAEPLRTAESLQAAAHREKTALRVTRTPGAPLWGRPEGTPDLANQLHLMQEDRAKRVRLLGKRCRRRTRRGNFSSSSGTLVTTALHCDSPHPVG